MDLIFFIKSSTVDVDNYYIKDIQGTSGRLDVISRCVLAAILGNNKFEKDIQMYLFLDRYGTFILDPKNFDFDTFPKNETLFTDYFVDLLQKGNTPKNHQLNPLSPVKTSKISMIEAIEYFQNLNYNIFILKEGGSDFLALRKTILKMDNLLFILGSQEDEFLDSKELLKLKIQKISIGNKSYLS